MGQSTVRPKLRSRDDKHLIFCEQPIIRIGSLDQCDVVIEGVEPLLFQLIHKQGQWTIFNLSSQDLKVNDKKVDMAVLEEGALVIIQGLEFEFDSGVQADSQVLSESDFIQFLETIPGVLSQHNIQDMMPSLLAVCVKIFGASHGTIFIKDLGAWNYPDDSVQLSQTAINKCLDSQEVFFWNQTLDNQDIQNAQSVQSQQLKGIIVAPLIESSYFYVQVQSDQVKSDFIESQKLNFEKLAGFIQSILLNQFEKSNMRETIAELHQSSGMLYECQPMQELMVAAHKAAQIPVPVFIHGETGTGKEVLAKWLHQNSQVRDLPFKAINCGAIPENLIEAELFGYVKGAFTGAMEDKVGLFESAEGGSVFLDELGELPLNMQVKLLRVLQEKVVTPLGSQEERQVEFRLISATHVNLKEKIEAKQFREDLYFRLNVMELTLPPLRERGQDILLLAKFLVKKFANQFQMSGVKLSKSAEKFLLAQSWPGNVRELENTIQKALIHNESGILEESDFQSRESEDNNLRSLKVIREEAERRAVHQALQSSQGNLSLSAKILDIDRKVLRDLLTRLEIDKGDFK